MYVTMEIEFSQFCRIQLDLGGAENNYRLRFKNLFEYH